MLNRRIIYFTLLLTLLGLIGIYWQLTLVNQGQQVKQESETTTVNLLTLNQELQAGQSINASQLTWQAVPVNQASTLVGALQQGQFNINNVNEAILAYSVAKGDYLRSDALVLPTDSNYLSVALSPGKRGLAIKVDAQSAMAGLVKPGDQVDVLFYHKLGRSKKDFTYQISASVRNLVSNVKLLAVDRAISRTLQAKNESDQDATTNAASFNEHSTVTLEVNSEQASKLLIAQQIGQLSLALVSKHGDRTLLSNNQQAVDFDQLLPELRKGTDIVNMFKGDNEEVFITNESLMMSTKAKQTGGEDNVF